MKVRKAFFYKITESEKYIFALNSIYNENGDLEKDKLAVYSGETLSSEPIWTCEVDKGNLMGSFVDEESGAVVFENCFEDGSPYGVVIGQQENVTDTNTNVQTSNEPTLIKVNDVNTKEKSVFDKFENCDITPLSDNRYFVSLWSDGKLEMLIYDRRNDSIEKIVDVDNAQRISQNQSGIISYSVTQNTDVTADLS